MATSDKVLGDKARIETSIEAFRSGPIAENAVNFFDALGYHSKRTEDLDSNTPEGLLEFVNRPDFFNRKKAHAEEWASINLLFQLTDEEVRDYGQTSLDLDSERLDMDSDRRFYSYLFFVVQLKKDSYNRTTLADITREINRFFDMPALVLFKYGGTLTLSVIARRLHKRDEGRDVLKKVTLFKDIRVENPHRAHVEILFDLAFPQLIAEHSVTTFVELHDAWRKTLDISELNKRFYKDLANWYFWALEQVRFPAQPGVVDEVNRAMNVIRLITRLTFVWFLKERQLVPDDLFRRESLEAVLIDLSPRSSTFYKAILQNLFFATLNTPMNDSANPRGFRKDTKEGRRLNDQYMVHNQYRHKKLFRDPEAALGMFASVPFLNGGLFECLDKREEVNGKPVETRVDGFSDLEKKQPTVPNRLFFCKEHSCADDGIDLNAVYGTRNKPYMVRGLIDTLNRYKFTIAENTPIDEEVALDPELLGKVFENLLASYNPETGATARKQTGSFYTPREIVNYMVDESLIAYLETRLAPASNNGQPESTVMRERDAQASFIGQQPLAITEAALTRAVESHSELLSFRLRRLFAYTDEPHGFTEEEVEKLIRAIGEVKILDPACGSGAYPMGILGKLVFILSKLDPQNASWKEAQLKRVEEDEQKVRELHDENARYSARAELKRRRADIEEAFRNNELDYGRKLFLIENCIYGVDIQPIAIQISKLRFFISLIIDQRIRTQAENSGVRPLPNLETKFVAANTLLGIEKPAQSMLQNEELRQAIEKKERELEIVREHHFTARTTRAKEGCRKEDERLRLEIGRLLEEDNWSPETTAKLIRWNPYDQNSTADFFDPEWMFGVPDGFDIVIANPPYGADVDGLLHVLRPLYSDVIQNYAEIFKMFFKKGISLLKEKGVQSYITPNTYLSQPRYKDLRKFLLKFQILDIVNLGEEVFEQVVVPVALSFIKKDSVKPTYRFADLSRSSKFAGDFNSMAFSEVSTSHVLKLKDLSLYSNVSLNDNQVTFDDALHVKDSGIQYHRSGIGLKKKGGNDLYERLFSDNPKEFKLSRPVWYGRLINSYYLAEETDEFFNLDYKAILKQNESVSFTKEAFNSTPKIIWRQTASSLKATLEEEGRWFRNTIQCAYLKQEFADKLNIKYVLGVGNSKYLAFVYNKLVNESGRVFPQVKLTHVKKLPLAVAGAEQQEPIIRLVDQILAAKRKDPNSDTGGLEREIDRLVYQLYGLAPEEIEIVEASGRR